MLSTGWMMLFNVLQFIDPVYDEFEHNGNTVQAPVWTIDDEESKKLGDATALYIESIPANKRSALKEFIEKHMPLIVLSGTILEVAGPRAQFSFEKKRNAIRAKMEAANNGKIGRSAVRSVADTHTQSASAETVIGAPTNDDAPAADQGRPFAHAFPNA
jgi:hypothetical protein